MLPEWRRKWKSNSVRSNILAWVCERLPVCLWQIGGMLCNFNPGTEFALQRWRRGIYSKTWYHVIAILGFFCFCFFYIYFILLDLYFLLRWLCADSYSCHQGSAALILFLFAREGCSHFHSCCLWLAALGSITASPDIPGKSAVSVCSRVV